MTTGVQYSANDGRGNVLNVTPTNGLPVTSVGGATAANPGSNSTMATAVQGVDGGKPVSVNDSTLGPYRFGTAGSALSAGGSTAGVLFPHGGDYRWQVLATSFGGGTLSMEALGPDNATWLPFSPVASLTANGGVNVGIPEGTTVRLTNTGGTGITDLNATAGLLR